MSTRPLLSQATRPATVEVDALNERGERRPTAIAGEHPLTLYLDKRELVTLMTLGQCPEALAIGYLRNQRLVRELAEIRSVQVDWDVESCAITTHGGVEDLDGKMEKRTVTTGCGQGTVFGDLMAEIDSVVLPAGARLTEDLGIDAATVEVDPDGIRAAMGLPPDASSFTWRDMQRRRAVIEGRLREQRQRHASRGPG